MVNINASMPGNWASSDHALRIPFIWLFGLPLTFPTHLQGCPDPQFMNGQGSRLYKQGPKSDRDKWANFSEHQIACCQISSILSEYLAQPCLQKLSFPIHKLHTRHLLFP